LQEIITCLGVKKVGAIAQQVKMINSLVKPQESECSLKRFREHSVGTAIIADKLVTDRLVRLEKPLEFSDYWIGTLLHDVGNLVLGFFFWDWMSRILEHHREGVLLPPGGGRSG
jgi:HD-like signal output (HDOD) protein